MAGAVLVGGASRRMGTDKAFIEIDGRPMVVGAVAALGQAGADPVVVVGGDPARLASLGLRRIDDRFPGEGPAQAVAAALAHLASAEIVVVLSCDLVAPHPGAIRTVVDALVAEPAAVVAVPVADGQRQWLHGAWNRQRGLEQLEAAWCSGKRSVHAGVPPQLVVEVHGIESALVVDADTPGDLPSANR